MYNRRKYRDMSRRKAVRILFTADAIGTARIIFDRENMKLQGILVSYDDECFSFRGYTDDPSAKQEPPMRSMTITVFDGETGHEFKVSNVKLQLTVDPKTERCAIKLDHPSLTFKTTKWYQGNRADVEIRKHLNPQMVDCGSDVFVGEMAISLVNDCYSKPLNRRVSLSSDASTVVLEFSNDFLA